MSEIKKVVLYKHGVGYFEREAQVQGNTEVRLSFRAEEMNDVLKSLTVFDSGGGTVSSISYDNQKPLARLLEESSLNIPSQGGGQSLLSAIRGATVLVSAGNRMVTGQIVGIEQRSSVNHGTTSKVARLTIFDEAGSLHSFDLPEVSSVRFLDEHIVSEIRFHFETLLAATKRDSKNLNMYARGEGQRTLSISYVVECPIWKTSYRMALAGDDREPPYLQGWALVDNPQDEDWTDVELSLVSGLPISFTHDLYSPRYLKRKEILVEREASAGPVMTEGALRQARGSSAEAYPEYGEMPMAAAPPAAPPPPMGGAMLAAPLARSRARQMAASHKVETVAQSVGQLFEYRIDCPVTVRRNQSALVPIVGSPIEGRRKILYNRSDRETNPFAIIDFKNTTGLTLEGGPLTVFEDDVYAGEAMLDTLAPDQERMVPYAVDLAVEAKVEEEQSDDVVMEKLVDGVWTQRRARYARTTYLFANNSERDKELILEHPISSGVLVKTPQPVSESRSYWRFAVTLPAHQSTEFSVTVKHDEENRQSLVQADPQWICTYLRHARGAPQMEQFLLQAEELAGRLGELAGQEQDLQRQTQEIEREQARLRENLAKLGSSSDETRLRSRYVGTLEQQEDELAAIKARLRELQAAKESEQQAMRDLVRSLKFEEVFEQE
jgi:hypothetical protein